MIQKTSKFSLYLNQLQQQYPQAFKRKLSIFIVKIKTKGLLDEAKEFIPWIFVDYDFFAASTLV